MIAALVAATLLGMLVIAAGAALSIRSVRSVKGTSPLGMRLQLAPVAAFLLVGACVGVIWAISTGVWPLAVLSIPPAAAGVALLRSRVKDPPRSTH